MGYHFILSEGFPQISFALPQARMVNRPPQRERNLTIKGAFLEGIQCSKSAEKTRGGYSWRKEEKKNAQFSFHLEWWR